MFITLKANFYSLLKKRLLTTYEAYKLANHNSLS
jgi:hypothetical protein